MEPASHAALRQLREVVVGAKASAEAARRGPYPYRGHAADAVTGLTDALARIDEIARLAWDE